MLYYAIKVLISAVVIVLVSEVAKRSSLLGALIASLPLTSLLALVWLYLDTKSIEKVSQLSMGIFWVVIPSLLFFISLPLFFKLGWNFWFALSGSIVLTGTGYGAYVLLLSKWGIKL